MPEFPSGTVAFLFTDIEGSTKRWERDAAAMRAVVERHFTILDKSIAANHGVRFKTIGDAIQAAFPTVPNAVAAALAGQIALNAEPWDSPLRVRMAVHVGAAEPENGDYLAPALNRLARLLGAGYGGQILLTRAAADLTRDALPAQASLRSLGEHRLRDLHHTEPVFQLVHPDLPDDFPPLKSLDIQRHNLPPQPTSFIGRRDEIKQAAEILQRPDVRLVTLTGAGGVGKTRLALEVARALLDKFPNGVWFVDLAPLRDSGLVPLAIARALGVREESGRSLVEMLNEFVHARKMLLVLDNFEHLIEAAPMLADLLSSSPASKALVTSRAPLRLRGERELDVLPLTLPGVRGAAVPIDQALRSEAVQLFVDRAEAIQPSFALTPETAPAVVEICRRLDGLPLAIELAAARVRILPPMELLARLDDRLRMLTGGPRDAPARQRTLRQTIAWSYDLLSPDEQAIFRRLAVFAGHQTLAAVGAIINSDGTLDALSALTSLVEESLIQQTADAGSEPRFAMLQTIRAFGLEQLAEHGEERVTKDAHARYFAGIVDRAQSELFGPEQGAWFDRFESDHDDLSAMLDWLLGQREVETVLRLVGALWRFWLIRGYPSEGSDVLAQVLDVSENADPIARSHALVGAGTLAGVQGDYDRCTMLLEEALLLAQTGGDNLETARALAALAIVSEDQGDFDRAMAQHEQALALYRKVGDQFGIAQELVGLGTLAATTGSSTRAAELLEEAATRFRTLGDTWGLGHAKLNLGRASFLSGNLDQAIAHTDEALSIFRNLEDDANTALSLSNLGEVIQHRGELERAASLHAESLALFRELGDKRNIAATLAPLAEVEVERGNRATASVLLRESLSLASDVDDKEGIARGLEAIAVVAALSDEFAQSVQALAAATALREAIGAPLPAVYRPGHDRILDSARTRLGQEAFEATWSSGREMRPEDVVNANIATQPQWLIQGHETS